MAPGERVCFSCGRAAGGDGASTRSEADRRVETVCMLLGLAVAPFVAIPASEALSPAGPVPRKGADPQQVMYAVLIGGVVAGTVAGLAKWLVRRFRKR
jgi:hypothetical protein